MARRMSASEKKARINPPKLKTAAARRRAVKEATSRVKTRTSIDFPRSVRSR